MRVLIAIVATLLLGACGTLGEAITASTTPAKVRAEAIGLSYNQIIQPTARTIVNNQAVPLKVVDGIAKASAVATPAVVYMLDQAANCADPCQMSPLMMGITAASAAIVPITTLFLQSGVNVSALTYTNKAGAKVALPSEIKP